MLFCISGWEGNNLGCVYDKQRACAGHAHDLGHGVFLRSFRNCDCLRVRVGNLCAYLPVPVPVPSKCKVCFKPTFLVSNFSGLDNKVTVYPLSLEDDSTSTQRKKLVGTHTSYTACCTFLPNSDYQVIQSLTQESLACQTSTPPNLQLYSCSEDPEW